MEGKQMSGRTTCKAAVTAVAFAAAAAALAHARPVDISPDAVSVVIEERASPVVRFAAAELTNGLCHTFGTAVPIIHAPRTDGTSIILGTNRWSRAEGLDPEPLVRDGFLVKATGSRVYLLGVDDPLRDPRGCFDGRAPLLGFERATLNAVYDFLERYADARFFFPGELGTVYARKTAIAVPEGLEKVEPAFTERYFGWWNVAKDGWHDKSVTVQKATAEHWLRLRYGTRRKQCCHGQRHFKYVGRFAKTHPEWFCLRKDGTRNLTDTGGEPSWHNSKFCYTSGIREAMYQDVKAFLTGQPPASRGLREWGPNCVSDRGGSYVDIMPEDGFCECFCPACQAAYDKKTPSYANELIWGLTAEIGRRLIADGVRGGVTQMAYSPYKDVPKVDLPPNVDVMVAAAGPWATSMPERHAEQMKRIRDWAARLGHKVWLWTYAGKYFGGQPGVPEVSPRSYAKFFSEAAPFIDGAYADPETDNFLFEVLNLYVYAKLGWNPRLDVEALLDEWHVRLFGAAKGEMARIDAILEKKWVHGVCKGRVVDTPLGPVTVKPSVGQLWSDIYSPAVIAELRGLFDAAASKVTDGSPEARRVALFRREFLDSLAAQSAAADPAVERAARAKRRPKNLLANGDFASKAGWEKTYQWGTFRPDAAVRVAGLPSMRLDSDSVPHRERNVQSDCSQFVSLKKAKRYRLSYFIRTKDVAAYDPSNGAGLCLWFAGNHYMKHPVPLMRGTCGWVHQSIVFSPPVDSPRAKLQFRLEDSLGTMWVAGALLEEVE